MTDRKLAKSVKRYLELVRAPDFVIDPRNGRYQETLEFRRALEGEFGRHTLEAEINRQRTKV